MKYYGFGNFYLSSIQQGIQNAHVISTMFIKYMNFPGDKLNNLVYWAKNDPTIILLNGGDDAQLHRIKAVIESEHNRYYPCAAFYEPGLGNALTSVGIVLSDSFTKISAADEDELDHHIHSTADWNGVMNYYVQKGKLAK